MKKLLGLASSVVYFLTPAIAFAQGTEPVPVEICDKEGQFKALCGLTGDRFGDLIGNVITLLFIIAVVVALAFLIWGGIKWILSGGDKSAVEAARNTIVAAVVGLVIVFLAYFILNIVITFFLGENISSFTIPTLGPAPAAQ